MKATTDRSPTVKAVSVYIITVSLTAILYFCIDDTKDLSAVMTFSAGQYICYIIKLLLINIYLRGC